MGRKKSLAGYRLHKERVLFSGQSIIRTFKLPLISLLDNKDTRNQQLIENLKQAIINDDLTIRGDLNLNDYLNYTKKDQPYYTLFDFWIDSLKAGIIWGSKTTEIMDGQFFEKIWKKTSEDIKKYFDKEKFKNEIILKDPLRNTSTKNSFQKRLENSLKEEYKSDEKAKELIAMIVNEFFDRSGKLTKNGEEQDKFWNEKFQIDKTILIKNLPEGKLKKITCLIIPELIDMDSFNKKSSFDLSTINNLIEKRINWLKSKSKNINEENNKELEDSLIKILCLDNNFNGFSNYLDSFLEVLQDENQEKSFETIFNAFVKIYPSLDTKENKDKILSALKELRKRALKLGQPKFFHVKSWADYRSVFGGKLKSWFTNYQKRKKEINKQVNELKKTITLAEETIKKINSSSEEKEKSLFLLHKLEGFLNKENVNLDSEKNYQVFNILLSETKRYLNVFYQKYIKEDDQEKIELEKTEEFGGLYKKIYRPVTFFGQAVKKDNEKFINIDILPGLKIIKKLLLTLKENFHPREIEKGNKKQNGEMIYRGFLQFFFKKIQDKAVNSLLFKNKYSDILKEAFEQESLLNSIIKKNQRKYTVFKGPYVKGTLIEVELKNVGDFLMKYKSSVLDLVKFLLDKFKVDNFSQDDKTNNLFQDINLLLDWVEASRMLIGELLYFNTNEKFLLDDFDLSNFKVAQNYKDIFSLKEVDKNEFTFFIQSLIISEIKGLATLMTKKTYLAKYTIQVIDSDKKFPLFYQLFDDKINLNEIDLRSNPSLLMKPHHYLVALKQVKEIKNKKPNLIRLEKDKIRKVFIPLSSENFLRLSSSPYQLQLLDKLLYKPKGWQNIDINLSEWGFIWEQEYQINWDWQKKALSLKPKENSKKNKLYLSIPFQIKSKKSQSLSKDFKAQRDKYPILGIDVGEYGLAYCFISVKDGHQIKILNKNFIYDRNISNIKDKFAQIQQRARQGVFEEKDNVVARVRKNAIGHLRNRVHAILTQKQDKASIVYEYSISNLETGSGRTIKIYNSVKRADVKLDSDADRQIHDHVWGKNSPLVGVHLQAYGSSYSCARCQRSLYQIKEDDLRQAKIISIDDGILKIKTKKGILCGFSQEEKYKTHNVDFLKGKNRLKEFRKLIKDFARPPVSKRSLVLKKYATDLVNNGDFIEKFKQLRGNSAIFVCPFDDCHYVADADIQAAFMMAIRGYLKFKGIINKDQPTEKIGDDNTQTNSSSPGIGDSYLFETFKFLKEAKFNPDNFFNPQLNFII